MNNKKCQVVAEEMYSACYDPDFTYQPEQISCRLVVHLISSSGITEHPDSYMLRSEENVSFVREQIKNYKLHSSVNGKTDNPQAQDYAVDTLLKSDYWSSKANNILVTGVSNIGLPPQKKWLLIV